VAVKVPSVAVSLGVVTATGPVFAPFGTIVVTWLPPPFAVNVALVPCL
jgi:hypothetical protein